MKKLIRFYLILAFALITHPMKSLADESQGQGPGPTSGPRRHLATIIFSGLGGAVLGLSTLSFYGRPQDRLGNIGVGFALGIIAGTFYVTYSMVKTPNEFYGLDRLPRLPTELALREAPQDSMDMIDFSHPSRQTANQGSNFPIANFNWSF